MFVDVGQEGRKVAVRYVDFGYEEAVLVSDLRKIKDEFFALPVMVRTCWTRELIFFPFYIMKTFCKRSSFPCPAASICTQSSKH